jgi:Fic family protein
LLAEANLAGRDEESRKAPAQYARSFLHSEQDGGDLTYFVLYQLRIAQRAMRRKPLTPYQFQLIFSTFYQFRSFQ